mgnify:CR=1 FL=1
MTKKKYRRYSPEFKRHALKRASEDGVMDKGVCGELGISERQLRRWRDQYRLLGDEAFPGQGKSRDKEVSIPSGLKTCFNRLMNQAPRTRQKQKQKQKI